MDSLSCSSGGSDLGKKSRALYIKSTLYRFQNNQQESIKNHSIPLNRFGCLLGSRLPRELNPWSTEWFGSGGSGETIMRTLTNSK